MQRKTVVLVCMVDSIHVARWIAQFEPTDVKFILFPSGPNRRVHPKILEMIENGKKFDNQITIAPFGGKLSLLLWALDRFFNDRIRGLLLRRILNITFPDFVHALELQHAGYVTMRALGDKSVATPFIATNYGSDIYWFGRFQGHKKRILKLLARADFYSAECIRDYDLAKNFGFNGIFLPLGPNSGGVDLAIGQARHSNTSTRKSIAIKGYHGWVGRAEIALEAVELMYKELLGYKIRIYSANRRVIRYAKTLQRKTGLDIEVYPKGGLSHEQVLGLFQDSRIYIGLSLSDGISTSLLEAMANGAFPIQTSSACASEWFTDGESGFIIDNLLPEVIVSAIRSALEDDLLVDNAQKTNRKTISAKADYHTMTVRSRSFYALDIKS